MRKVYFSAFQSECSICSRFTAKIRTNEREIRSLLQYFSQRVPSILSKDINKNFIIGFLLA